MIKMVAEKVLKNMNLDCGTANPLIKKAGETDAGVPPGPVLSFMSFPDRCEANTKKGNYAPEKIYYNNYQRLQT